MNIISKPFNPHCTCLFGTHQHVTDILSKDILYTANIRHGGLMVTLSIFFTTLTLVIPQMCRVKYGMSFVNLNCDTYFTIVKALLGAIFGEKDTSYAMMRPYYIAVQKLLKIFRGPMNMLLFSFIVSSGVYRCLLMVLHPQALIHLGPFKQRIYKLIIQILQTAIGSNFCSGDPISLQICICSEIRAVMA